MRSGCGWNEASILNISSRGLQISTTLAAVQGTTVEIWHGEHLIIAHVVWRKGTHAGLMAEQRVPVEELMTLSQVPKHILTAPSWPQADRRKRPRSHDDSRLGARFIEFAGMILIGGALSLGALMLLQDAFSRPLAFVEAALRG